jgi:hypothetical protein
VVNFRVVNREWCLVDGRMVVIGCLVVYLGLSVVVGEMVVVSLSSDEVDGVVDGSILNGG